jgi:hypothetical protein
MGEDQFYPWLLDLSGDPERARVAALRAAEARAKGMSHAEAADVALAALRGDVTGRAGRALGDRLLRDAGAHALAAGALALLFLLAAHGGRGTVAATLLALVGIAEGIRGWSSPFRLALPGIVLCAAALVLAFQPAVHI